MKTLEHVTDIDAPADAVWAIVADFAAYDEWNPFMTIAGSPAAPGDRFQVTIRPPDRRATTLRPTVTTFVPGSTLTWLGRFLLPRLFDGTHTMRVEPLPDGRSRFTQHESFRGVLVPLVPGVLRDTGAGFAVMNAALKAHAESRVMADQPPPGIRVL
jgi:hypothetical protein